MPEPVTWERRDKAYRAIYEALGGQNPELINWERRGEALKAIHDAIQALGAGSPVMSVQGAILPDTGNTWLAMHFADSMAYAYNIVFKVPAGKTLTVLALGRLDCDDPDTSDIRVSKQGVIATLAQLGKGVFYKEFSGASVAGPTECYLLGLSETEWFKVSGWIAFKIANS